MKLLLVDDEKGLLEQAKIYLEKENDQFEVDTALSAEEGLQMLEEDRYDVIVSDYQMPEIDGLEFLKVLRKERDLEIPFIMFTGKGREKVAMEALNLGADRYLQKGGDPKSQYGVLAQAIEQEVRHWRREEELKRIGWSIKKETRERDYEPPYGDLSVLNEDGLIKNSVSKGSLIDVTEHFMQLLDSSCAIYEKEGDYALGIFSSGWCQYMDARSHELCDTEDDRKALESGEWLCHESCWEASKECMEKREPVDTECNGGIDLYAVPIEVDGDVVGAMNFGYGDPPEDEDELKELADKYDAELDELKRLSKEYEKRPEFIIEAAKNRIKTSARLLSEIIKSRNAEHRAEHLNLLLRSIRNVNQIIVQGDDLREIMKSACESLVEIRSYLEVTISLLDDESGEISPIAQAGEHTFKNDWSITLDGEGEAPDCIERAVKSGGIEIIDTSTCGDCAFKDEEEYHMSAVVPMKRGEDVLGLLKVSLQKGEDVHGKEKALLREVANDLAFARDKMKVEKELEKSEERYRRLFETAQDGMLIIDAGSGEIIDANPFIRDMLGYSLDELKGKQLWQIGTFSDVIENKEKFEELREEEYVRYEHLPLKTKDGEEKSVEFVSNLYMVGDKEVIQCNIRDITERKEKEKALQEAKQNYEELFEKSADALYVIDPDTAEVLDINQRMCEMYGYSREEALELTIEDTSSGEYPYTQEEAKKRVQKAEEDGPITFEWRGQKKDGTLTWEEVTLKQAEIGGESRILASVRDISERKKAEEREEFLHSLLRHDVKNKIQIVKGYLDLVEDDVDLPDEAEDYIQKAEKATRLSDEIIEKVRKLKQIKQEDEIEEVDIDSVLDQILSENKSQLEKEGIDIEIEETGCRVKGGMLLEEMFSNLVENSILHSDCDKIRIQDEREGDECVVTVEDDGKGIPDDVKEKIFDRGFKKGENAGSGLGMYLVKEIVESYGGHVEVGDSDMGGARFEIRLRKLNNSG